MSSSEQHGPMLHPIRRVPVPTRQTFRKTVARAYEPVLLDGLVADWPALRTWSLDYLIEEYGHLHWSVLVRQNGSFASSNLYGCETPVLVRDHLHSSLMLKTEDYMNVPFAALPAELAAMAPALPLTAGAWHRQRGLFIGSQANGAPLHFHLCQNLLIQIFGKKRVVLFHPRQGRNLGWTGPLSSSPNFSPLDPFATSSRRFDRYESAVGHSVDLEPGDALYIPMGWWHATKVLSPSISLFERWASGWSYLPILANTLFDKAVATLDRRRSANVTADRPTRGALKVNVGENPTPTS